MLRYLGAILVVVLAAAVTGALGVILLGGLAERLPAEAAIRVIAFDTPSAVADRSARLRAAVTEADGGSPVLGEHILMHFEEGQVARTWFSKGGQVAARCPMDLGPGPHGFTAGYSQAHPRLDVWAPAAVWVWPAEEAVLWFDVAGVMPLGRPSRPDTSPAAETLDALDVVKTLAGGGHPVYLVAAAPEDYAGARRRLKALRAPPGPCVWVEPGREPAVLKALHKTWPRVRTAVLGAPAVVAAAKALKVPALTVPLAGDPQGAAGMRNAWRDVLERATSGGRERRE